MNILPITPDQISDKNLAVLLKAIRSVPTLALELQKEAIRTERERIRLLK